MEDVRCGGKHRKKRKEPGDLSIVKISDEVSLKDKVVRKLVCEREKFKRRKINGEAKHYLGSFIQKFSIDQNPLFVKQNEDFSDPKQWKGSHIKQTIDLCESDKFVNDSKHSGVLISSFEVESRNVEFVDLSDSILEKKEVIDLTESVSKSEDMDISKQNCEPTIIDISEDDITNQQIMKSDNDEVLVIGIFSKSCHFSHKYDNSCIQLKSKWKNQDKVNSCSDKLKRKYIKKQSVLDKVDRKSVSHSKNESYMSEGTSLSKKISKIGENVYVNSPLSLPSIGLRPVIIDGSNVAFVRSNSNFSCKRLQICINYFKEKGHKVTAFVPQFRVNTNKSDDPLLLRKLERQGDVVLTPSKRIDGKNIVPYDDRFIVQTAVLKGGVIVTRDNYNDLLKENPAWAETIKYRCLSFIWVDDMLMFPKDPLGEHGPSLEDFLRFH